MKKIQKTYCDNGQIKYDDFDSSLKKLYQQWENKELTNKEFWYLGSRLIRKNKKLIGKDCVDKLLSDLGCVLMLTEVDNY